MLSPFALKLGVSALAIAAAFGLGWKICSWKNDSEYKKAYNSLQMQYNELVIKNKQLSDSMVDLQNKNQKRISDLNARLREELKNHVEYSNCIVPDSGVQLYQSSIESTNKARPTK